MIGVVLPFDYHTARLIADTVSYIFFPKRHRSCLGDSGIDGIKIIVRVVAQPYTRLPLLLPTPPSLMRPQLQSPLSLDVFFPVIVSQSSLLEATMISALLLVRVDRWR